VHRELGREVATAKAKDLVRMAVAKASRLQPIQRPSFDVNHQALVIGGGLAGLTAALTVADQGFDVVLVERSGELGGNLTHIYTGFDGSDPRLCCARRSAASRNHARIRSCSTPSCTRSMAMWVPFESRVREQGGKWHEIKHGVIVIATGAREIEPREYGYRALQGVITQREYEERLGNAGRTRRARSPVGGDDPVCRVPRRGTSILLPHLLLPGDQERAQDQGESSPDTEVYVLYRDIRTFGFKEDLYREARQRGVVFLQYDPDKKPAVTNGNGRLLVSLSGPARGRNR
jgi:heterodisulfide reductase subunit A2